MRCPVIASQRENASPFPRGPRNVRRADVPAPLLPHVFSRKQTRDQIAERNRADEIRDRDEQNESQGNSPRRSGAAEHDHQQGGERNGTNV